MNLVIVISNGNAVGSLEFYSNGGFLGELAQLFDPTQFHDEHAIEKELGSEQADANFAFYLRLRLCRINEREFCLSVRMNNNAEHRSGFAKHEVCLTELALLLTSSEVEELGIAMNQFAELDRMRLLFSAEGCVLDDMELTKEYMASDSMSSAWRSLPISLFE